MSGRTVAAVALAAATAAVWAAATADLDPQKSTLAAQFKQMNVPVEAPFRHFSGGVQFDPARPDQAVAHIEVDTGSFELGDEDYNSEVRKPEWFDSARFPMATFDAKGLKPAGPGKFETDGTLSLKGKSQPLHVILAVSNPDGATAFDGTVPISRSYFQIGGPDWKDSVADEVLVKFHIVMHPGH